MCWDFWVETCSERQWELEVLFSAQLLSNQIVRIRNISSVCEGLEKAKIQKEETGLQARIVSSLKTANILWPLSPPILTLDKLLQLRQHGDSHISAKWCMWLGDPRVTSETQLTKRLFECRTVMSSLVLNDDNNDEKSRCFVVVKSKDFKIHRPRFMCNVALYWLNDLGQVT